MGSNRDDGLIWWGRGGGGGGKGLFNLTKTIVSVVHKDLEYNKVENLKYKKKKFKDNKTNPNFQLVSKPSLVSPHEVLQ